MGSRYRRYAALVAAALSACGSASKPTTTPLGNASAGAGGAVDLTWVVSPPSVKHPTYEDILLRPLALEITINGAKQVLKLSPQMGSLFPHNQIECNTDAYPLSKLEVAKITFYEGGAGGYVVRRELQDTLVVLEWSLTDGACEGPGGEPVACPPYEKILTTYKIPTDAMVKQAIVEIDAKGSREPFSCAEP